MPYLGNQHIVGDSVNNFKVLDDISSFTATFDGSSASVVSTANETIKVLKHRFVQGQRVTYNNGGGSNIGGLSSGTAYYIIYDTAHTIKLATSASNAASLTAINLSGVGGGASHTLNVAFDGVNTKFRITHSSGNRPHFHHATQLSIAINNVIQKPNNDLNFTEGYAVEVRDTIVFKTAPTVNDIFFGSLTGETRGTFDITDHRIDRFTADGTTTLYDLTQNVPNNESLLVTLNGVVQHPTTGGVTGSYNIVSGTTNKLQFTTAPAAGVDIQIRHLGFAGASSGEVSGFYGRTGNVGLNADDHITTGDIISRNINASGIITATSFIGDGSGLIGVASTDNIVTGTAATFTGGVDINSDLDVDGHTNLDNVNVAGISTFSGILDATNTPASIRVAQDIQHKGDADTKITFNNNNVKVTTGNVERLSISGENYLYGSNHFWATSSSPKASGFDIVASFRDATDDTLIQFYNINTKNTVLEWNDTGNTTSAGNLVFKGVGGSGLEHARFTGSGNFNLLRDLDVDGHTNLDNVSIAGVATFSGNVSIAGTLTYEDVTNIDSVGLITARKGIISSGVVTATAFSGDGSNLTGVVQSDRPAGGSSESEIFFEVDTGVSISTTTTLSRASSNPGRIFTKVKEIVVGTSSPSSVELIVAANEQLVVDYFDVIT